MRKGILSLHFFWIIKFLKSNNPVIKLQSSDAIRKIDNKMIGNGANFEEKTFKNQILFIDLDIEPEFEIWISKELYLHGISFLDKLYHKNSPGNKISCNNLKKFNERIEKVDMVKNLNQQNPLLKSIKEKKELDGELNDSSDYKSDEDITYDIKNNDKNSKNSKISKNGYEALFESKENKITNMVFDNKKYDFILYTIEDGTKLVIRSETLVYIFDWNIFKVYLETTAGQYYISYQHQIHFNDRINKKVDFRRCYKNKYQTKNSENSTIKSTQKYQILNRNTGVSKNLSNKNPRNSNCIEYVSVDCVSYEYLQINNPEIKNFKISSKTKSAQTENLSLKNEKGEDQKYSEVDLPLKIEKERKDAFKIYESRNTKKEKEKSNEQLKIFNIWNWLGLRLF